MSNNENNKPAKAPFNRVPLMLALILLLLIYVGIQITEGLGWLSAEEWIEDIGGMVMTFLGVIIAAALFSFIWIKIVALKRERSRHDMDFYLSTSESDEQHDVAGRASDGNKGEG